MLVSKAPKEIFPITEKRALTSQIVSITAQHWRLPAKLYQLQHSIGAYQPNCINYSTALALTSQIVSTTAQHLFMHCITNKAVYTMTSKHSRVGLEQPNPTKHSRAGTKHPNPTKHSRSGDEQPNPTKHSRAGD